MKKPVTINIPEIQKYLKTNHTKFIKDVGVFSSKISQDHQLRLTRMVARITRIIECFVESKIIDQFSPYSLPYADNEYTRSFSLKKNGYADSVYLWTDGETIIFGDSLIPISKSECESIKITNQDNFDGIDFTKVLLDYIHRKIYSRKESYEQRIFGI